jgi:hypothetical protein
MMQRSAASAMWQVFSWSKFLRWLYGFGAGVSFSISRNGETPSAYATNRLTFVLLKSGVRSRGLAQERFFTWELLDSTY